MRAEASAPVQQDSSQTRSDSSVATARSPGKPAHASKELDFVPGTKFLKPSGPHKVAIADLEPEVENGTIIRLYYPCDPTGLSQPTEASWLPSWRYAKGYGDYAKLPSVLSVPLIMLSAGWARKPCAVNRPLAGYAAASNPLADGGAATTREAAALFPVMIFSHGLAGMRTTYSSLCTDYASRGFVVAAVEHRDGSACVTFDRGDEVPHTPITKESEAADGSMAFRRAQLAQRVAEVEAARNVLSALAAGKSVKCCSPLNSTKGGTRFAHATTFAGRLDLKRTALMGHSFGAATALATTLRASPGQYAAVIALDAWLYAFSTAELDAARNGACPPILFVNNEKFQWKSNIEKMEAFPRSAMVTLAAAGHMSQSDFPLLLSRLLAAEWRVMNNHLSSNGLLATIANYPLK
eukprot:jgi/Tetstr1/459924/TSEL_005264.t1